MSTKVKLTDVRIAFCDSLWEAKEYKPGDGKFRRSATFLIVPGSDNDKAIEAAITAEAKATFDAKKWEQILKGLRGQKNQDCYRSGDDKTYDGFEGMKALAAHRKASDGPVGVYGNVIDPDTGKVVVLGPNTGKPYAGCYVNATVEIYAQKGENPGIRAGLQAVQFHRDGDAFSGSKPASPDDFAPTEGADAESLV